MKTFSLFLLLAGGVFAAAPSAPAPDAQRLYRMKCSGCHGLNGEGGAGASFRGKLAHHTTVSIESVIKNGISGTAMPANPTLPEPAIHKLALYVEYLNKKK